VDEVKVEVRGTKLRKCDIELLLDFRWMVCVIPKLRSDEELLAPYDRRYDFLQSGTDLYPTLLVPREGTTKSGEEGEG
jgi:hypothetical protein